MRKASSYQPDEEANIWPAMTDTILLIASIFIVFSVLLMLYSLKRMASGAGEGTRGEQLIAKNYEIREGILFSSGQWQLKPKAGYYIRLILKDLEGNLEKFDSYASNQGWKKYYVVLEASGHADCDLSHSAEYPGGDGNWDLSTKRANAVIHSVEGILKADPVLKKKLRVYYDGAGEARPGSTVLRASGYSSHLPAVSYPRRSESAFSTAKTTNRRVELRAYVQPEYIVKMRYKAE